MNEIRLAQNTVLRLAPGVAWVETEPGRVTIRRGRGAWATAGRRTLGFFGAVLFVGALSAASFAFGTSVGAGIGGAALADAASAVPAPPDVAAALAPAPPRVGPPPRGSVPSRPTNPEDPFGLR